MAKGSTRPRRFRPECGFRWLDGVSRARRPANPSDVTSPCAPVRRAPARPRRAASGWRRRVRRRTGRRGASKRPAPLCPAPEARRPGLWRKQRPEPDAPTVDEGDRRRGHGRNGARPVAGAGSRRQPRPGYSARLTLSVEPRRLDSPSAAPTGSPSPTPAPAPRTLPASPAPAAARPALRAARRRRHAASRTESGGNRAARPARSRPADG